jgi:hypothetical protein
LRYILRGVRGCQRDPQARRAARDGRVTDGGDENALRAEFSSKFNGFGFITNNP